MGRLGPSSNTSRTSSNACRATIPVVGILVAVVELPWELVSIGVALVPMSRTGEDQLLLPWAGCSTGTNELIGEDLSAIINLDAGQLMH